jgi:hypothetical protein
VVVARRPYIHIGPAGPGTSPPRPPAPRGRAGTDPGGTS